MHLILTQKGCHSGNMNMVQLWTLEPAESATILFRVDIEQATICEYRHEHFEYIIRQRGASEALAGVAILLHERFADIPCPVYDDLTGTGIVILATLQTIEQQRGAVQGSLNDGTNLKKSKTTFVRFFFIRETRSLQIA